MTRTRNVDSQKNIASVIKRDVSQKGVSKLQKHRANMVEFRLKKKVEHSALQTEHRHLERVMAKYTNVMKNEVSLDKAHERGAIQATQEVCELIVEKEALRRQNVALCNEIERHQAFREALMGPYPTTQENDVPVLPVSDDDKGWWVRFSHMSPSFYFHPFSPDEVTATTNPFDASFIANLPAASQAGPFLGWSISRHLSYCDDSDRRSLISRVRVTKRVQCSLDRAVTEAVKREEDLRPLLMTPDDWNFTKRGEAAVQVLQEIDSHTRVMAHDIPGLTNVRYVFLARTGQWELHGNKRKMGFSMTIVDSAANKLSRDAEMPQEDVEWITQGWAYFTLTEVDSGAVDVDYEHCVGCTSESQDEVLMAQGVQVLVRWEQIAVPSNLVTC
ncbi:hypothetical protein PHYPSEUDO_005325 [Phytophthora pseudosyringae]|uniref:Uncharacterized protein n=1 Tax=Phytophthora pseudosyringae TaxID=221518 RepID=A0A8T1VPG2_9STRA|nr:hypothetical protein PHYPSEUDO_005325 [Phytophthora pseudosyringae]